jgi:tetratricopeptide (TPR) repeat protein
MDDPKLRLEALAELTALHKMAIERGDAAGAERFAAVIRAIEAHEDASASADANASEDAGSFGPGYRVTVHDPRLAAAADLNARYREAFERGDVATAEQLSARMRDMSDVSPASREMEKVGRGERLILMERWAEARDVLASIDRAVLPLMNRPGILNNLAYATALAGDPERAIEWILQAQEEAEAIGADYPREKLQFMRGTQAIALSLADKHEEAIAILEPLIAIEKPVRARSTRAYFLGRSYRAIGRTADAARAFELAAGGEGPFVEAAKGALGDDRSGQG